MALPDDSPAPAPAHHLPGWFRRLQGALDAVTALLNVIGTLLIVAIMLLVNADVLGRVLLGRPVSGVPEMVSLSIVAIVFLQIAQTFRQGRLTRAEMLHGWLARRAPRLGAVLDLMFALAAAALVWQILKASWPLFLRAWQKGTYTGTVGDFIAPLWPVKGIILIGCAALLAQLAMFALAALFRLAGRARP